MRRRQVIFLFLFIALLLLMIGSGPAGGIVLTQEEQSWLNANAQRTFNLGLEPDAGTDFFTYLGRQEGYLLPVVALMKEQLGLDIRIIGDKHWKEVYEGLQEGSVDILFGANVTEERQRFMSFTQSIQEYPYAIFALHDSDYHTLGDLKNKRIGFLDGDYIADAIRTRYPSVSATMVPYPSQDVFFEALASSQVDAVVTEGSEILYTYRVRYPESRLVMILNNITSDRTLSARLEDRVLTGILDKFITANQHRAIQQYQQAAQTLFNYKSLGLTPEEIAWIQERSPVKVGVTANYLPYEYYGDGQFKGIMGAWLNRISSLTGIRFEPVEGPFSTLLDMAKAGEIDILNVAKTESRKKFFNYGVPYEKTRDIILGRLDSQPINSINDLEGTTVAVVRGFWHKEYLYANLSDNVKTVGTADITESITLLRNRKVDYLIDNPVIIQYYLEGLGYNDLIKQGDTTADSYMYLAVTKHNTQLASVMDKAVQLISPEEMKAEGLQTAPRIRDLRSSRLVGVILLLVILIAGILLYVIHLIRELIHHKVRVQLHVEREALLRTDVLTGLGNRAAFVHLQEQIDAEPFPQAVIVSDLNNLKQVNDTYGHAVGDELLINYAEVLKQFGHKDLVFRMGGDEFLMLLPRLDDATGIALLNQIGEALLQRPVTLADGSTLVPVAAIGYAFRYSAEDKLSTVFIIADNNMYEAKRRMKS